MYILNIACCYGNNIATNLIEILVYMSTDYSIYSSIHFSEIYFKHKTREKALSVRQVKADKIGKLVNVRGIVTRTTEVKPCYDSSYLHM